MWFHSKSLMDYIIETMYGHEMKHTAKFPVLSKGDYLWYSIIQMDSSFPAFLISWAYAVYLATDIFVANYWFII